MKRSLKAFYISVVLVFSAVVNVQANAEEDVVKTFTEKMKSYQGKVVYVDFWASWCGPCAKSFPWMNAIQDKYRADGLQVLTINLDAEKELADEFLAKHSVNFDVIYDSEGLLAQKFQLKGMPNSFIFNQNGELVSAHVGFTKEKQMEYEQALIALLEKSSNEKDKNQTSIISH